MIELETKLNRRDIFNLQLMYYKDTYMGISFIVLFLAGILSLIQTVHAGTFDIFHVFFPVIALVLPLAFLFQAYWIAKKTITETTVFHYPITYQITSEYLNIKSYQSTSQILWKDVHNQLEDKNSFYVYISSLQAFIIPKRDLKENEIQEVQKILIENVIKKKKTGKRVLAIFMTIIFVLYIISIFIN